MASRGRSISSSTRTSAVITKPCRHAARHCRLRKASAPPLDCIALQPRPSFPRIRVYERPSSRRGRYGALRQPVSTRVPPWSSLPREETCPIIAVPSSSSATFARKVTWVGPNFTVRVVSYEPSSNRSPSFAPGTQSPTARGSDSTFHTIRGAAGTSTRSLISITMWTAGQSGGQIFTGC